MLQHGIAGMAEHVKSDSGGGSKKGVFVAQKRNISRNGSGRESPSFWSLVTGFPWPVLPGSCWSVCKGSVCVCACQLFAFFCCLSSFLIHAKGSPASNSSWILIKNTFCNMVCDSHETHVTPRTLSWSMMYFLEVPVFASNS